MKDKHNEGLHTVFVSFWLGMIGILLIMVMTGPRGIGTGADSVQCFQAAKFVSTGEGFLDFSESGELAPFTRFPPLYPGVLSLGSYFGLDVFTWARILAAFLFGLNVFFVSMLAFRLTGHRRSALMAGGLALISVHMVEAHMVASPQALFLALMLAAFWALMRFIEDDRGSDLVVAAVLAGFSMSANYGGSAVIATGAVLIWSRAREEGVSKLRNTALYVALAALFPALWFMRNLRIDHRLFGYEVGFFSLSLAQLIDGINTLSMFLLPSIVPAVVRWVVLALFLWALLRLVRDLFRHLQEESCVARLQIGWMVVGTFVIIYACGALVAALTITPSRVLLGHRTLLPLLATAIILVPTLIRQRQLESASRRLIGFSAFFLLLFLALSFLRTAHLARDVFRNGYGYNARTWAETVLVKNVKTLSDEIPVYASDPYAFYFYTGRPAVMIPREGQDTESFSLLEKVRSQFINERAVAVIFDQSHFKPHADWSALATSVPFTALLNDNWGSIYGYKKSAQTVDMGVR